MPQRIPNLVRSQDYHTLLLFCIFIANEAAIRRLQNTERDFMSLREKLKGSGAQVVLSILPFGDWDPGGRRCKVKINY